MTLSGYLNDRLTTLCQDPGSHGEYTDAEIDEISRILEELRRPGSKCPRTYIVLQAIGHLDLLDTLIDLGFDDQWFPVEPRSLPASLSPEIRTSFATAQSLILTKSLDVEKGRHRHFSPGEPLPFEIKNRLGNGGYSQVDRIQSRIGSRSYALKRIRRRNVFGNDTKEAMKRFRSEVEIMRSLSHRHIVQFIGSYTDKTFLGIITSPVADMDLAVFLKELCRHVETGSGSSVTIANEMSSSLRSFFGCLAAALAYLHDNRVRHKDIKPQNILISQGTVIFTDFGLSRHFADGQGSTTSGLTAATPRYSPPEVAAYEQRNTSADIWSLGCVFLEMLAALEGHDVDWVKDYFLSNGTREPYYQSNPSACQLLLEKYENEAARIDRTPVKWIRQMMVFERGSRWTAAFLLQQIISGDGFGTSSNFCGICCMGDEGSDSHDSLVDEPTNRSFGIGNLTIGSNPPIKPPTQNLKPAANSMSEPISHSSTSTSQKTPRSLLKIVQDTTEKAKNSTNDLGGEAKKGRGARQGAGAKQGVGTKQGAVATVMYDYERAEDNEIELKEGERITNIEFVDEDWWMGQNALGEVGLFPSNFVELEVAPDRNGDEAIAMYDYEAMEDNELAFPEGARITNLEYPDDDWWYGTYKGKSGLFPSNYVDLVLK